jgi:AcrR family transcriptional regulator
MGITERKEREKLEIKELILLKAKEIMVNEGQDKLSIRKIAAAVEYSPATIYLYFQDKDEIVYEMMQFGFSMMAKYFDADLQEQNAAIRIRKVGEGYVRFGMENPDWYDLMFNSMQPIKHIEKCKTEWGVGISLFEMLVAACDEAIPASKKKLVDPRIVALQLWSNARPCEFVSFAAPACRGRCRS